MARKIMVVDDEQDVREFLGSLLADNGYEVTLAEDGNQAFDQIEQDGPPDLILLDLLMPGETGTGLYRKLHNHKQHREIPVIVVSGLAGRNVAVSKSVPVFDKPIEADELLAAVERLLA